MTDREKLIELLGEYFTIGDSYVYNLTRDKRAFAVGTMDLDDFEEFDDESVAHIADHLLANGVVVREKPHTNADRMIAMIQNRSVSDLLDWWQEIFEDGVPGDDYFKWWLELPVKDGEDDG